MKNYKNILALFFIALLAFSCVTDEDKLYSLDYIQAPTNVNAVFDITQDNTGVVTILPNAEGVITSYSIHYTKLYDQLQKYRAQMKQYQREALIAEKEIIRLRNEKLRGKMIHLDKELANQTMGLIQT